MQRLPNVKASATIGRTLKYPKMISAFYENRENGIGKT